MVKTLAGTKGNDNEGSRQPTVAPTVLLAQVEIAECQVRVMTSGASSHTSLVIIPKRLVDKPNLLQHRSFRQMSCQIATLRRSVKPDEG